VLPQAYQAPSSNFYQQSYPAPLPQQSTFTTVQQQGFPSSTAYLPLPLQIEANVRMILQQVTNNIQSFEQAVSRQLRGY
jgi:hypothetical protein